MIFVATGLMLAIKDAAPPPPPRSQLVGDPLREARWSHWRMTEPEGIKRPGAQGVTFRAELLTPVKPSTGLVSESFIFHVVVYVSRPTAVFRAMSKSLKLHALVASLKMDADEKFAGCPSPTVHLLAPGPERSDKLKWALLALPSEAAELGQVVAELSSEGLWQPAQSTPAVVSFAGEQLQGAPISRRPPVNAQEREEQALVLPVVVRSAGASSFTVSLALRLCLKQGIVQEAVTPAVRLEFKPSVAATFEATGPARGSSLRRLSVNSTSPTALVLTSVGTTTAGPGGALAPAIGTLGRLEPSASQAFVLPPSSGQPSPGAVGTLLVVRLRRAEVEAFCPWPAASALLMSRQLPDLYLEWPLPPNTLEEESLTAPLRLEVEVPATGTVAVPVVASITIRRLGGAPGEEVSVQICHGEKGDFSDKCMLSGPMIQQVLLTSSGRTSATEGRTSFAVIPLKPGWLALPRIKVACGEIEASSSHSSVFVFPAQQPVQWRTT